MSGQTYVVLMGPREGEGKLRFLRVEDVEAGVPKLRDEKINMSVAANTDIFDEDLTAEYNGFWIIQITADTAGYPLLRLTPAGSAVTVTAALNEASDLTADALYEFWVAAKKDDAINIRFSTSATVTVRVFFARSA